MIKFYLTFAILFVFFASFSQKHFSGFIRDSQGKPVKQCRVTALFSSNNKKEKKTDDNGYFSISTPSTEIGVYDSFEIYLGLNEKFYISTTDYDNVVTLTKQTNRIDISLSARARNVKKAINISIANKEDISREPLYFKIQLRATPEPIKKETLGYLERKIKDLNTSIEVEESESGVFKYRYYIEKTFQTRLEANNFLKKLNLYKMKGFVVPFFK